MMTQFFDPATIGGWVATFLFAGIIGTLVLGHWLGRRNLAGHAEKPASSGSLEATVFALLGLLIAFTFSGALSRFDSRRATAVQEANAMGTVYLRLDLLPKSAQPRLRDAVRAYADARIATYRKLPDIAAARAELERSQELQGKIWRDAIVAVRLPGVRPSTEQLVVSSLNEMFDLATTRIAETRIHPPGIVYWMLVAFALAAALLAGYQSAGEKDYDWVHKLGFAAIIALTVYVILDIEHPRFGLVRLDAIDQVLVEVRAGMR